VGKVHRAQTPPPIIEVEWDDIVTRSGWLEHREKETGPAACRTVGYVLVRDDKYVVLSASWSDQDRADTTTIPMGVVRSITELRK
jgi:hypothetical protein